MKTKLNVLLAICCIFVSGWAGASCKQIVIHKEYVTDCVPEGDNSFCQVWSGTGGYGNGLFRSEAEAPSENCGPSFPQSPLGQAFCISRDDFVNENGDEIWAFNVAANDLSGPIFGAGIHYVEGGSGRFAGVHGKLFIAIDGDEGKIWGELCGFPDHPASVPSEDL